MQQFCLTEKIELLWNKIDELKKLVDGLDSLFVNFPEVFEQTKALANEVKNLILKVDPFVEIYAKKVCSNCINICCLNKNSRYEYDDLIYILALREKFPLPERNLKEKEPCYLLTEKGCKIPRYLRPLRCNWYFCKELLQEMETAPPRAFREFSNTFNKMLYLRQQMLNSFFQSLSYTKGDV
ncbi:hypothetical protein V4D30_06685 [Thermodesulfovibrio sp. 3907-1M]|uniref:YkgJ family cysteine cluster protein n=1 Tax=Thermodesulfovibrio autotrophicus TaxID=3118333 RepID=A0AAU8GVA6_9BACT